MSPTVNHGISNIELFTAERKTVPKHTTLEKAIMECGKKGGYVDGGRRNSKGEYEVRILLSKTKLECDSTEYPIYKDFLEKNKFTIEDEIEAHGKFSLKIKRRSISEFHEKKSNDKVLRRTISGEPLKAYFIEKEEPDRIVEEKKEKKHVGFKQMKHFFSKVVHLKEE